ncbi:MAG: DUF305 domain-containing protein, partial [Wenzhouxiangella sp.]
MTRLPSGAARLRRFFLLIGLLWSVHALAASPIIQPGAPGEPSRQISAEQAIELAGLRHSAADVRFMSDMIPHHQQALDMSALAPNRSQSHE